MPDLRYGRDIYGRRPDDAVTEGAAGAGLQGRAMSCVFCDKIASGDYLDEYDGIVHFEPLNPVVPGHLLVVPKVHVADALEDPRVTGMTMAYAANLAKAPCNLITSAGREATQSVFHLHIHVVPRIKGDGLKLPWSGQVKE